MQLSCAQRSICNTLIDAGDTLLFCAADRRLIRAAQGEGLPVLNPEEATEADVQRMLGSATP